MESIFIKELLETAARFENKVAFVDMDGNRSSSYGQLLALAQKVAAYLRQEGVAPHSNVCIRMPDTMEFMAAELGVWLSRCVVVPIGMNSPEDRVESIVQDCGSALLIDEKSMLKITNLSMSGTVEIILPESTDDALLVYTSGSTGVPKGILHTFEPFDRNYPHTFGLALPSPDIVFGNGVPFYFMAIVFLYDMLRAGATIHLYSDIVKADARNLQNYIQSHGITVSHISPAVLLNFLNRSSRLKAVVTAGERLTTQCSKNGYVLYNLYGLSETSGTVTSFEVGQSPLEPVPIGTCNPGIEFRIVGENGEDVPMGEEGELYLKGCFCKGYYNDPEHSRKLLVDGWLHTGDIFSQGPDGLLYYKNRMDWMVKVNGQRVEPGEVETSIRKMPDVVDSAHRDIINDGNWKEVEKAFDTCLEAVDKYRSEEGAILYKDVTSRVSLILSLDRELEKHEDERIAAVRDRITAAAEELGISLNKERFEQEMIFYLEKFDINEEKVRLRQHCNYFIDTIDSEECPGKKLGFIIQEMGREINTTGSKANNAEIQKYVVRMKDELEKIREQSMNIL